MSTVRSRLRALGEFLLVAVRPLRGLPRWLELPGTLMFGLALLANTAVPDERQLTDTMYGWIRANRLVVSSIGLASLFLIAGIRQTMAVRRSVEPALYFTRIIAGNTFDSVQRKEELYDGATGERIGSRRVVVPGNPFGIEAVVINAPEDFHLHAYVREAVARIAFFSKDESEPVFEVTDGYWPDNGSPAGFDRDLGGDRFRLRDLPPNGQEHRIAIAMKFPGESDLRPWSVTAMRHAHRVVSSIPPGTYRVEFTVSGVGLRRPFMGRFWIVNPEGTGDPSVHLDEP